MVLEWNGVGMEWCWNGMVFVLRSTRILIWKNVTCCARDEDPTHNLIKRKEK